MPFYPRLKRLDRGEAAAKNLLRLRKRLRDEIPARTARETLLLATWNLRDFGANKWGHGHRLEESLFYIAEIISSFDLVAVQEVNEDLKALRKVMDILGPSWDFIATDVTAGSSGNGERMVYVFDSRKVRFKNIAGEIVLPRTKRIRGDIQFARTPFHVGFEAGWLRFFLCTVHIYYGARSGTKLERRIDEIGAIAEFLAKRSKKQKANFILLGDFNIVDPGHQTMEALKEGGFVVPKELRAPTNVRGDKHYDQIAFRLDQGGPSASIDDDPKAGTFEFFKSVFRTQDWAEYIDHFPNDKIAEGASDDKKKDYFKRWRTWQISDHLPLWVELEIDYGDQYLKGLVG